MEQFDDVAIPIAWPDQTARGDEKWMQVLKNMGLVKNLNFRVGHAAIVLAERKTGDLRYFDFGRYITPRGYGRARSSKFDPRLTLHTKGAFDKFGKLTNLEEILNELSQMEHATHGSGRLLCSLTPRISFRKGVQFAEQLVQTGPILYGALAKNNNSCSRYVAQIMVHAMPKRDARIRQIYYPEFIKASPTSNVVNGSPDGHVFCYSEGKLARWPMSRMRSLQFQVKLLQDNFTHKGAMRLSDDSRVGFVIEPNRPSSLPNHAQWLGGIGEGRWFALDWNGIDYQITRYDEHGKQEYSVLSTTDPDFNYRAPFTFTHDIHFHKHVVQQGLKRFAFTTVETEFSSQQVASFQEFIK